MYGVFLKFFHGSEISYANYRKHQDGNPMIDRCGCFWKTIPMFSIGFPVADIWVRA